MVEILSCLCFILHCGAKQGVQLLLDGVVNYLPCPLEVSNHALDQNKQEEKVCNNFCPTSQTFHALLPLSFLEDFS
jgi:translation elongation factor EF-G